MSVDTDMVVRSMAGPALGDVIPNVATLLERNALQYGRTVVFQQKREGKFAGPTWAEFVERIRRIAWSLRDIGFRPGERCAIVSPNRLEMLEFELAIMASGGVAVPIFAWYPPRILSELVSFCRPSAIVAGGPEQLARLDSNQPARYVIALDDIEDVRFPDLLHYSDLIAAAPTLVPSLSIGVEPHKVCLMQYTSGTSGKPKCVQLTHRNILSQQVALQDIWPFDDLERRIGSRQHLP
jgi:long-chain acyl-CoA synthetase